MRRVREFAQSPAVVLASFQPMVSTTLGIVRSLGRAGVPVILVGTDRWSPATLSRHTAMFSRLPDGSEQARVESLVELGRSVRPRPVLFVSSDDQVVLMHAYRSQVEDVFSYPFLTPESLEAGIDKAVTCRIARDAGVPAPLTWVIDSEDARDHALRNAPLPCVVKPSFWVHPLRRPVVKDSEFLRQFSEKAVRATTRDELREHLRLCTHLSVPPVVQEEIPGGPERIHCCMVYLTSTGEPTATYTCRKTRQMPSDFGSGTFLETTPAPEIERLSLRLAKAAQWWGAGSFEFKFDERTGEHKIIEISVRLNTWTSAAAAGGVNVPYAAYEALAEAGPGSPHVYELREGVKWMDAVQDLKYFWRYRRGDHTGRALPLREYLRSLTGTREFAYLSASDPLPGLTHLATCGRNLLARLGRAFLFRTADPRATEQTGVVHAPRKGGGDS